VVLVHVAFRTESVVVVVVLVWLLVGCCVVWWLVVSSTVFIGLYAQVSYVFVHCVLCKFLVVSGSVEIER